MLLLITLIVFTSYVVIFDRINFWKKRGVYQLQRTNGLKNYVKNIFFAKNRSFFDVSLEIYQDLEEHGQKFGGTSSNFTTGPVFVAVDPNLVKNILVKDFDYFMNHGFFNNEKVDPLTGHLFNLEGAKWKEMRQKLTPTFSSGKVKVMFQTMLLCTKELEKFLRKYELKQEPVPILDCMARLTTDIIANIAFGIECNSIKNPDTEFRKFGRAVLTPSVRRFFVPLLPKGIAEKFEIKLMKPDVENFFIDIVRKNMEYREQNNIVKNDFFQLMLQLKNQGIVTDDGRIDNKDSFSSKLTFEQVAAQCFLFFIAGFDTSSNVMTFTLYELSKNQELQENVRQSINDVVNKYDGAITYDAINEMEYLQIIVDETMRKYPIFPLLFRACSKDYKVPDSNVVLKSGTSVWIPVAGIHRDPKYYPNPEEYNPERFRSKNSHSMYFPFGEGPRQCIGIRFGLLQTKLGLATIIRNFRVSLNIRSTSSIEFKPLSITTCPKSEIYLNLSKI